MKHTNILFLAALLSASAVFARNSNNEQTADSISIYQDIPEVEVKARLEQPADNHTILTNRQLQQHNIGQNLPFLLSTTPSLVATSDDGLGIGYTYFRMRGTDHARINMTVNNIPLNDSESQTVFWVNMTDMTSSLSCLNIQRGVGTSTNGSSAFGASLNMQTLENAPANKKANVELSFNGGMYNTFREMLRADILLPYNMRLAARVSKVNSDGYLYRAKSDLFSYYTMFGWNGQNTSVWLDAFGGNETTYMAWDGVSKDDLLRDRRYNPAGAYYDADGNLQYYDNQNDYYQQQHYQLHLRHNFSDRWQLHTALHYTRGQGYYEQMKADKKYSAFGLDNYRPDETTTIKRSNFVRQKHLDNHFFGLVADLFYRSNMLDINMGGAVSDYLGDHFGLITDHLYNTVANREFYRSNGTKLDANVYAKADWRIVKSSSSELDLYADLQYRFVDYRINGVNDEDLNELAVKENFHFFNPKAGITYQTGSHRTYFSFAIANREPNRKNYTEAGMNFLPRPERLYDYELGYAYTSKTVHAGVNLYFMDYKDQLVLTGKLSDTGAALTRNVNKSYRMGAELTAGVNVSDWFTWDMALTVSRNRILGFIDWIEYYDADWNPLPQKEVNFGNVTIAMSPSVVFSNTLRFNYKGFSADIHTQVVSKQYLDNTMSEEAVLKPYSVSNLRLQYTLPIGPAVTSLQQSLTVHQPSSPLWPRITIHCQVNNLFNARYESNGGNWMCMFTDGSSYYSPYYYAQAGTNVHAGFTIEW